MSEARSTRWPALDGIRAVAVVLVVAYHADGLVPNGFLGVDVFFVLSGFLITTLLLAERDATGEVRLGRFYARRFLRLAPALAVVCLAAVLLSAAAGRRLADVVAGAASSVLYVSNLWKYSGHPTPLLEHTWTLALEWQFYLLWPLLLLVALRRSWLLTALGLAVTVAWLVGWAVGIGPVGGTYLRTIGIALGCALAIGLHQRRPWLLALTRLAWPGLVALVLLSFVTITADGVLGPVLQLGPSLAAVPLVVAATASGSSGSVAQVLGGRLPVWLGERSYGLYLWHFPLLSIAINNGGSVSLGVRMTAAVVAAVLLAAGSYRWVEQPVLRWSAARTRVTRDAVR